MKLRTRLPRASTTAAVAASAPNEQPRSETNPKTEPGIDTQQCAQILQQLEAFDTEGVFSGELTRDGRLVADGPLLTHNLRYAVTLLRREIPYNFCSPSGVLVDFRTRECILQTFLVFNSQAAATSPKSLNWCQCMTRFCCFKCLTFASRTAASDASVLQRASSMVQDHTTIVKHTFDMPY